MPEFTLFNTTLQAPTTTSNYAPSSRSYGRTFRSTVPGSIVALRHWRDSSDPSASHIGRLWRKSTQIELLSVTYQNQTASGWQEQRLGTPFYIEANTEYVVSVNFSTRLQRASPGANPFVNGYLSSVTTAGSLNSTSSNTMPPDIAGSLYFADIVFVPAFSGSIQVVGVGTANNVLTAIISDLNTVVPENINYQWQSSNDNGVSWGNISGETMASLLLSNSMVGNRIRATVSYVDAEGFSENLTSAATSTITNTNDVGLISISGTAAENEILTASITDTDGLIGVSISYQWQSSTNGTNWSNISGATSSTLLLTNNLVNRTIRVLASYTDQLGTNETLTSSATSSVVNVNNAGSVLLAGIPLQGQTLTALIVDDDGVPGAGVTYQWQSTDNNGVSWQSISGATSSTFLLTESYIGTKLRVLASYEDSYGTTESITSVSTNTILNINDVGSVAITYVVNVDGSPVQGATLTAVVTDPDGINNATITYQWLVSGCPVSCNYIDEETSNTLILTNSLVGKRIRVLASYQDDNGNNELIISNPTPIVVNLNDLGSVSVLGTAIQGQTLTALAEDLDGLVDITISYQWQSTSNNGVSWQNIAEATDSTLILTNSLVGKKIRVNVAYTDNYGTTENLVSDPTGTVANVNDSGSISIVGTVTQGQTLTTQIMDYDGLNSATINYQWESSSNYGVSWQNITGANDSTLILTNSLVGKLVRVLADYVDDHGSEETVVSDPTTPVANVNDTGLITVLGTNLQGETLSISIEDIDGIGNVPINYQWQSSGNNGINWQNIDNAIDSNLILTNSLVGKLIRVTASYIDNRGTQENLISDPTTAIANLNDLGSITIGGVPAQGQTITAVVEDIDGVGTINYVWQSSGNNGVTWQNIAGATTSTITLSNSLVGRLVRVTASYTDSLGTQENLVSDPTTAIANLNDTGAIVINGVLAQGQILTALVEDADEVNGTINYQWQSSSNNGSSWQNIQSQPVATLLLTEILVGKSIRVIATYVDTYGNNEIVVSSATNAVANLNDGGVITISGIPSRGELLTAFVEDIDGLNAVNINYQWQSSVNGSDWVNINGETSSTILLTYSLVGKQVRAIASYIDDLETSESLTSLPSDVITGGIDEVGTITITGSIIRNQTITVVVTDIDDEIEGYTSYQWLSKKAQEEWVAIPSATAETLFLGKNLVNNKIRVIADYVDLNGTILHSLISTETSIVANINELGMATITGTPVAGLVLTASVTDEDEVINAAISYQWQFREESGETWEDIVGATTNELLLSSELIDKRVRCLTNYFDELGTEENLISNASDIIIASPEVGSVSITGTPRQYNQLTAVITDTNGVNDDSVSYQWQKSIDSFDWEDINGETLSTLYLNVNLIAHYIRVTTNYLTGINTPANIFSEPTDKVYSPFLKSNYFAIMNPLVLVAEPTTTFTFPAEQEWVIDEETGNSIPGNSDGVVLVSATLKQVKDPNLSIQAGVDYNRVYFEGYLLNPRVKIEAEQGKNIPTVINGREGIFNFVPVIESREEIQLAQRQINGQRVAGYFRFT
jgi:hypothetical protein